MNKIRIVFQTTPMWLALCWAVGTPALAAGAEAPNAGTVRGTIIDAATGQPAACTVTLIDSRGQTVIDKESFRLGFRCDGQFNRQLLPGRARVRVTRGFEVRAVERVLEVPAGGTVDLTIALERVVDLRRRGWFSGDSHAHMIHGERTIPVTFDDVALAARAEDLQYLSLSHAWTFDAPTPETLDAELGPRSTPDCVLTWNLEAPKNYYRGDAARCLGHCWSVGMRGRTANGESVIDLLLQASAHDYESDKPTFANFESHQLIRAQGGAVFYTHPARWWMGPWGGQGGYPRQENQRVSNMAVELPLDTLIGPTFDGLDVITTSGELQANAKAFELWALLLNRGYRIAATASSDACFDRPGGAVPGIVRTYTYLPDGFSLPAVARATAQGKTFVTTGPLLLASVNGQPPGSAFPAGENAHRIQIEAWASGADPKGLTRLEVFRNGNLISSNVFAPPIFSITTNIPIAEKEGAWYSVRAFGGDPQRQRASTGAFFFDAEPFRPPAPVPARVWVELVDAETGAKLPGSVTELTFHGPVPKPGGTHPVQDSGSLVEIPGTVRLRAEAPGYQPQTLSPVLDSPPLIEHITQLSAENLLQWETFERVRALLSEVKLTFRLNRQ